MTSQQEDKMLMVSQDLAVAYPKTLHEAVTLLGKALANPYGIKRPMFGPGSDKWVATGMAALTGKQSDTLQRANNRYWRKLHKLHRYAKVQKKKIKAGIWREDRLPVVDYLGELEKSFTHASRKSTHAKD